jgi:transcriptional regulator with XRE-family HTH domain
MIRFMTLESVKCPSPPAARTGYRARQAADSSKGHRMNEPRDSQMAALGAFIRRQRQQANLSLRQLADRTKLSNPYLSQIERGLHEPSVRVIRLISEALNVSAETLLAHAGLLHHKEADTQDSPGPDHVGVEAAIQAESRLTDEQKNALIAVLRSMLPAD